MKNVEEKPAKVGKSKKVGSKLSKVSLAAAVVIVVLLTLGYLLVYANAGAMGDIKTKVNTSEFAKEKFMKIVEECESEGKDTYFNESEAVTSSIDIDKREENYIKFVENCIEERNKNTLLNINYTN